MNIIKASIETQLEEQSTKAISASWYVRANCTMLLKFEDALGYTICPNTAKLPELKKIFLYQQQCYQSLSFAELWYCWIFTRQLGIWNLSIVSYGWLFKGNGSASGEKKKGKKPLLQKVQISWGKSFLGRKACSIMCIIIMLALIFDSSSEHCKSGFQVHCKPWIFFLTRLLGRLCR